MEGTPMFCAAPDCAQLTNAHRNCAMCHLDFCHRCTSAGVFCHTCLQHTFLTRDPPLPDPSKTAQMINAPESIQCLVAQIEQLKTALGESQRMVKSLQSELLLRTKQGSPDQFFADSTQDMQPLLSNLSEADTPPMTPPTTSRSTSSTDGMLVNLDTAPQQLTKIFLREQDLSQFDSQLIAQYLKGNAGVEVVDLSDNMLQDAGATVIADAMKTAPNLARVVLYNASIRDAGACAIADAVQMSPQISVLELSENLIADAGACSLARALQTNGAVTDLGLSVNGIGDVGATAIANAVRHSLSLRTLTMDYNRISDAGATSLASALSANSSLTAVDLGQNSFSKTGLDLISAAAAQRPGLTISL